MSILDIGYRIQDTGSAFFHRCPDIQMDIGYRIQEPDFTRIRTDIGYRIQDFQYPMSIRISDIGYRNPISPGSVRIQDIGYRIPYILCPFWIQDIGYRRLGTHESPKSYVHSDIGYRPIQDLVAYILYPISPTGYRIQDIGRAVVRRARVCSALSGANPK